MSIEQTDVGAICLYDSVTGIAFGPVFTGTDSASPQDEADAFVRWFETGASQAADNMTDLRGLATFLQADMRDVADEWRKFVAEHREDVCPFDRDRDSYGIGYTGDSDKSRGDYTEATPDPCQCECHSDAARMVPDGQKRRY
jgi:hypothetical protein